MSSSLVNVSQALSLLKEGELVAIPTETVYGLAGRMDRDSTVKNIFTVKKRPLFYPLIVHFFSRSQLSEYVDEKPSLMEALFAYFSPGPLTLVVRKNSNRVSSLVTGGRETVAVRIPAHPMARSLLERLEVPLAAPSANLFGEVSPTRVEHVLDSFQGKIPVLDGGPSEEGLESTIVEVNSEKNELVILRPGSITSSHLEEFAQNEGFPVNIFEKTDPFQSGGSKEHYKPKAPLIIVESEESEEDIQKFLKTHFKKVVCMNLGEDPKQASKDLYHLMRKLSEDPERRIFVKKSQMQSSEEWNAIWNRPDQSQFRYFEMETKLKCHFYASRKQSGSSSLPVRLFRKRVAVAPSIICDRRSKKDS